MSKTLKIFEYKGQVAASSDIENGCFLNDIKDGNQIGVVVAVKEAVITSKALEIMKTNYVREGGSFAPVMLTNVQIPEVDGTIGVVGFGKHGISVEGPVSYSRDCDLSLLDNIEVDDSLEIPEDFIEYIDSL